VLNRFNKSLDFQSVSLKQKRYIQCNERRVVDEKKEATVKELTVWILEYMEQNTAGSPTDENNNKNLIYCPLLLIIWLQF